jgi:hypothetical protein
MSRLKDWPRCSWRRRCGGGARQGDNDSTYVGVGIAQRFPRGSPAARDDPGREDGMPSAFLVERRTNGGSSRKGVFTRSACTGRGDVSSPVTRERHPGMLPRRRTLRIFFWEPLRGSGRRDAAPPAPSLAPTPQTRSCERGYLPPRAPASQVWRLAPHRLGFALCSHSPYGSVVPPAFVPPAPPRLHLRWLDLPEERKFMTSPRFILINYTCGIT